MSPHPQEQHISVRYFKDPNIILHSSQPDDKEINNNNHLGKRWLKGRIGLNFGELPCISVWKIITEIITSRNRYRKHPCKNLTVLCNQLQLIPHFFNRQANLETSRTLHCSILNTTKTF